MGGRLVVGFDLDMTLVDSAVGIAATLVHALSEQGIAIDPAAVWPLVGLPLQDILLALAPQVDLPAAVGTYRASYPAIGAPAATALPGAAAAVAAAHARDGRVIVVSAKVEPAVRAVLRHTGFEVGDLAPHEVAGGLFAAAKAPRLRTAGAQVFVGDHPGDVEAARLVGAVAIGVATGPHGLAELRAAGADVALPDLLGFPDWLDGWLTVAASG